MYPSESAEAKRQRSRQVRERQKRAGVTEIILALPKDLVAELDAAKLRTGLRSRSQVVLQMLQAGRAADQQNA
jgi:hypothetical protein